MKRKPTKSDYDYCIYNIFYLQEKLNRGEEVDRNRIIYCKEIITTYRKLLQDLVAQSDEAIIVADTLADREDYKLSKNTLISQCELSVRTHNVLKANDTYDGHEIKKIGDLQHISVSSLKSFRNTGQKTVEEIIKLANSVGVKLKP
jgi:DNA-directed RNA polymerase alpha subunit